MKNIRQELFAMLNMYRCRHFALVILLALLQVSAKGQTFEYPNTLHADTASLKSILQGNNRIIVQHDAFGSLPSDFSIKSVLALTNFYVDVQSDQVGKKPGFTYMISYYTVGYPIVNDTLIKDSTAADTLTISYDGDSLKLINNSSFKIAGKYHKLEVVIDAVYSIKDSAGGLYYTVLGIGDALNVPDFVHVCGEIYLQKYFRHNMTMGSVIKADSINANGTVRLDWGASMGTYTPAGYEVEWTYADSGSNKYNFRNNSTRIFTNNTSFNIPVAQKQGHLIHRIRMVRPDTANFLRRIDGPWNVADDQGDISSLNNDSKTAIPKSLNDSFNWDLKMSFVEDGKYKQVVTYYDGLLKPKQVQTRFNTNPEQTIVAHTLYDHEGRAVINSLPIPVDEKKFAYINNFLRPATGEPEYYKSMYDAPQNPDSCAKEEPISPLHIDAPGNQYFSANNPNPSGINAFIPDAEGYPMTRRILAAENSEKILFDGKAGSVLQFGNGRQMEYVYGSPLQAELNKYFGQDIGKSNYYRKMVTTDNHEQDMFSITDDEGKIVASGLIGSPDTNSIALNILNNPDTQTFVSNLLPIPYIREGETWLDKGAYFVEKDANYAFKYKVKCAPYFPCPGSAVTLLPKVYYTYEVVNPCGDTVAYDNSSFGTTVPTEDTLLLDSSSRGKLLIRGNHVWKKHSYIKMEDLRASVDAYLDSNYCNDELKSYENFLYSAFSDNEFPCDRANLDPCSTLRKVMRKEMYPRAKYGMYRYDDTLSKTFVDSDSAMNSIFTKHNGIYRYQDTCLFPGESRIAQMSPQELINAFNDEIADSLLPLHPDYCKLMECDVLNDTYTKKLAAKKTPPLSGILETIVMDDSIIDSMQLPKPEFKFTVNDERQIDSVAFQKTICGSESGMIEGVCIAINNNRGPDDIVIYSKEIQDEYYKNLIALYSANRDIRITKWLQEKNCDQCSLVRLVDPADTLFFDDQVDDSFFFTSNMDTLADSMKLPGGASYNPFDAVDMDNMRNADNSRYCLEIVKNITGTLSSCDVSQNTLDTLSEILEGMFCHNDHSITSLSYDSLTAIMQSVGITVDDLCNAGLVDLRRITRASNDYVQLGLLHYAPGYYEDLTHFLANNVVLDSLAANAGTIDVNLELCPEHPFQNRLAKHLGSDLSPNCNDTLEVQLEISYNKDANAVKLKFINIADTAAFYLYPSVKSEYNAFDLVFDSTAVVISNIDSLESRSLFNLHGFDKVSKSYANRNSIVLNFKGTQGAVTKRYSYFLSAFNADFDHNMMRADQEDYLNGIGCSELYPMMKDAVTAAEQVNIKYSHPYFEEFIANTINYRNNVNFDYNNYYTASQSCGFTDSFLIKKHLAHFKIKFPSSANITDLETYVDTLRNYDTTGIGISDVLGYKLDTESNYYILLSVYEANDLNMKQIKEIVLDQLPAGSVVDYMPSLERNTLAHLFSYDIDQVNTTALNNALSGLSISSTPADVCFFRPDTVATVLRAALLNVSSSSPITNDGLYNRYVDSIYRFVKAQAVMTTVYTHAEPSVSPQYYDAHMSTWRNYIMGLSSGDHGANVDSSKANMIQYLKFPGKKLSYTNTRNPYYFNDLYIGDQSGSNFYVVNAVLEALNESSTTELFEEHHNRHRETHVYINGNKPVDFYNYVCSDTTQFMINYFVDSGQLNTIFVQFPEYLEYPRESYSLINLSKGFEKDSVHTLTLTLKSGNDTIRCTAYTTVNLGAAYTIPSAYLSTHGKLETSSTGFDNCESQKLQNLTATAMINFRLLRENLRDSFVGLFRQHIIDNLQEEFTISGIDIKHGVTLYYYDMADNLVMTVPPAGVAKMAVQTEANNNTINNARLNWTGGTTGLEVPNHAKVTKYTYNAQNKVRTTFTPDAGKTENFYDPLGRIIISQNEQQRTGQNPQCTYFIYDNLSRVIETGLTAKNTAWDQDFFLDSSLNIYLSQVKSQARSEVTVTVYDTASYNPAKSTFHQLPVQENLKNRIAGIRYFGGIGKNVNAQADTNYISGLHYSYDVSGNVKTLIHDLKGVDDKMLRFKRVDYEYDLYSGKVLMVSYNRGGADQMYQKYSYDSDNRITDVESSNNGIYWDRDANYEYYAHGPLARMNLGEQRVQGVDYAYTINGWLKAINGVHNDSANDMGRDGATGVVTPKDVFSQRIDYFNGDYKAIGGNDLLKELPQTSKSLYNGNIAAISTSLAPFENVYAKYHYDPLHRIDRADYDQFVINNSAIPKATVTALVNKYNSHYRYDADGNILQLVRYGGVTSTVGSAQKMDSMNYHYSSGTNKLKSLSDAVVDVGYKIDIPQTSLDTSAMRYDYDNSGNLVRDDVAGINNIKWYNNGKVRYVETDSAQIYFSYDPLGNRLTKEVVTFPTTDSTVKHKTIYVRDATGNILAIYEDKKILDVTRFDWNVLQTSPWTVNGGYTGPLWGPFTFPVSDVFADALITAFNNNPTDNVAQLAMAVPDLNSYTADASGTQTLVNALDQEQGLDFVQSNPSITEFTLSGGGMTLTDAKLAEYMQPVMMSNDLDNFQTDVFVALKDNDPAFYNTTVATIPASGAEKMDFPMNPGMLTAFKGMDPGDRLNLVNTLAYDLATTYTSVFPYVKDVLVSAFSDANSHPGFVSEIPGGDIILDAIKQDASNYVAHRFMEADMELVPLADVQDEFKSNPVLVNYLAQQAPPPTQAALADIISHNFGDVLTVADNNGLQSVVVEAFQDAITANMDYVDHYIGPWIRYSEVLKSQQQYLSEHHLYGSSRVGLQKYLPDQLQYSYALGQTSGNSFNTLMAPKPWYSRYAHDLFTPAATRDSSVTKTNLEISGMGIMSHVLGNRHYELNNHLGNVQATVLDRVTPIIKPIDTSLIGYKADISTAQDYYPFGMLMPGRYVADTAAKCVTINTTILVPHEVRVYPRPVSLIPQRYDGPNSIPVDQLAKAQSFENEEIFLFHYNDAGTHPGGVVATSYLSAEGEVEHAITLDGEPSGGVISYLQLHMDTTQLEQEVGFTLELPPGVRAEVRVRQYYNTGEEYYPAIDWTMIETNGPQQLYVPVDKTAIGAGGNTLLEMQFMDNAMEVFDPGATVFARNYYTYISHYEPQARIVTICDEKDNYRFGFNGKEKDNEVKSIGNSYDYGARIYASRLGRFMSVDPLADKFPWLTPYQFASNTPISAIDLDGLEAVVIMSGEVGGYGKSKVGEYAKYKVFVFEDMTIDQYKNDLSAGKIKKPDASFLLTRDAWNRPGKTARSTERYGTSNEVPPGEYFLEYKKGGYSSKGYEYKVSDKKGGDIINGPDGQRSLIRWHRWDPCGSDGCSTTGTGSDDGPARDIADFIPSLKDGKEVKVIYLERNADYDSENKLWRGGESIEYNPNSSSDTKAPPIDSSLDGVPE